MDIEEFKKNTAPRAKRSKLQPYLNDIVDLRSDGYSYGQIADYLANKGVKVSVVRLSRFVKEQQNQIQAKPKPEAAKQKNDGTPEHKPGPGIPEGLSGYPPHDPRMISQILGSPVDLDDLAKYAPKRKKP
jgi:hypothetical protein